MLNKHKLFLLCAKWIPVVTAIGILVTNTIAYYGCNDIVVDIFNFNIGTIHSKKNIFIDGKDKLFIRCSKESITKCYF